MLIMTPAHAAWILDKFCLTQRKLNPRQLEDLKNEIRTGNWWLTHQGVVFVRRLSKDGQHRLFAIVETGIAVPLMVCLNLLIGATEAMDQHSKRSAVHQSQIRGDEGSMIITPSLSAAAKVVIKYSPKMVRKYGTSAQGTVRMLDELRGDFFDPVEVKFREASKAMPHLNNGYVKAAIIIRLMEVQGDKKLTDKLRRFYQVLTSGEVKEPSDYVMSALSHTLARDKLGSKNMKELSDKEIFLLTLKAIVMFFDGEEVKPTKLLKLNNTEKVALATSIGVDPAKFDVHSRKSSGAVEDTANSEASASEA